MSQSKTSGRESYLSPKNTQMAGLFPRHVTPLVSRATNLTWQSSVPGSCLSDLASPPYPARHPLQPTKTAKPQPKSIGFLAFPKMPLRFSHRSGVPHVLHEGSAAEDERPPGDGLISFPPAFILSSLPLNEHPGLIRNPDNGHEQDADSIFPVSPSLLELIHRNRLPLVRRGRDTSGTGFRLIFLSFIRGSR